MNNGLRDYLPLVWIRRSPSRLYSFKTLSLHTCTSRKLIGARCIVKRRERQQNSALSLHSSHGSSRMRQFRLASLDKFAVQHGRIDS
jgi:hypothetical protein